MRRTLLIAALVLGSLAGLIPHGANADHCGRIFGLTRNKLVPAHFNPGVAGCLTPAHVNANKIMPAADELLLRVSQAKGQPIPVSGTLTTDNKVADLNLQPNTGDAETATLFEETLPIGSTSKFEVKVQFADGTEQSAVYTR